jgi:hypothetical protein
VSLHRPDWSLYIPSASTPSTRMASDMTISKVLGSREWNGQHGPMVTYKIELEGHGPAELNQKPTSPPPQEGQSIFGDLQPGREGFPPKLKKAQQNSFGGGGKSPEQQKSIVRQHSQEMALRFLATSSFSPQADNEANIGACLKMVKRLTDWFEKDATP